jgi:hypothetical protein
VAALRAESLATPELETAVEEMGAAVEAALAAAAVTAHTWRQQPGPLPSPKAVTTAQPSPVVQPGPPQPVVPQPTVTTGRPDSRSSDGAATLQACATTVRVQLEALERGLQEEREPGAALARAAVAAAQAAAELPQPSTPCCARCCCARCGGGRRPDIHIHTSSEMLSVKPPPAAPAPASPDHTGVPQV